MRKPSVTQLLDLLAKPALIDWANRQGLAGVDINVLRSQSKSSGRSLHEQIEKREFADPLHAANFDRFMADKTLIDQEQKIETEWFVGRYDARLMWRGETWLIDYKKATKPTVYFEHRLQLAAYSMGVKADRFGIVAIPGFNMAEAQIGDSIGQLHEIVLALATIWRLKPSA
jgi:hypothetical protein